MVEIKNRQVCSTEGRLIHRLGTDTYFRRGTALPTDTPADFEEVDSAPAYTRADYEERVATLVRERYTDSAEFAIQRKYINSLTVPDPAAAAEYADYNSYVNSCKLRARQLMEQGR